MPKKLPDIDDADCGGTSVFTSGLPVYSNVPETVPVPSKLMEILPLA